MSTALNCEGFLLHDAYFYPLSALSILTLATWVADARLGARLCVFIYAPAFVLLASVAVNGDLAQRKTPDVYDRAGIVARNYLTNEDISKLVLVGSYSSSLV